MQGKIQELIFYTSSQATNRPLIINNINNYYNIYTGSNHGFVARWYDQSGNNRHASQTTAGSQPLIVSSGSVIFENSKPALTFDGIDDRLSLASNLNVGSSPSIIGVAKGVSYGTSVDNGVYWRAGSQDYWYIVDNQTFWYRNGDFSAQYTSTDGMPAMDNLQKLIGTYKNSNSALLSINGSVIGSKTSGTGTNGNFNNIGSDFFFLKGNYQEQIIYTSNESSNRGPIEYNINNYYNIYPQTSSFATSSFTIQAGPTSVSASLNNRLTSGISTSGPLGLITVSRTGSNSLTIARNGASTSFTVPASGALSTGIYLGAINNNGLALGNSPVNISFASVGTGLNEIETLNLNRLVYNLQSNFKEDTDATAFITAAQLTNPTIVSAVRSLVLNLKGYGLWDKLKAIYPIVSDGISQTRASQHKWNLKDPRDLDAAYRLAFQPSGWTHSNTGALPNGNTYANTFFAPNLLPLNSAHMSYYSRTATTTTSVEMGIGQTGFGEFLLAPRYSSALYDISRINSGYPGGGTATVSQGLFTVSRVSSTGFKTYKNDTILTNRSSATSTTAATLPIWIGALNLNGGISDKTTREVAFATIGEGLTDFEAANLYTVVQTFQTTLGRQV
jgi:hypothetical protein